MMTRILAVLLLSVSAFTQTAVNLRSSQGTEVGTSTTPLQVTGANGTFPISGTVTTNPPANATTNITQFGGTNVVTGTGTGGLGIPRVTVSSDSFPATQAVSGTVTANQGTANTAANAWPHKLVDSGGVNVATVTAANALKVDGSGVTQPVSGTFFQATQPVSCTAANCALNITQFGGVNLSTGTGASGTGIPRVTISNDSSLAANQSVNVAQFGGTNTVTGTGASGAGIPRVTVSNDSVVIATQNQPVTYTCSYQLAARPLELSSAVAATARKQYATIYHAGTAVKKVKLRRVDLWLRGASAGTEAAWQLERLTATTAPATGNPAITPGKHNTGDAAAEATCLALPTTAGSEGDIFVTVPWQIGTTGSASLLNPPPVGTLTTLYDARSAMDTGEESLVMRAATAEGFAVVVDNTTASTITATVVIRFTEE